MAILQLDLWGNPVSIPEKNESLKGNTSITKQETFDRNALPPSLPLFEEERNELVSPFANAEIISETETITLTEPLLYSSTVDLSPVEAEIKIDIVEITETISTPSSNDNMNEDFNNWKESINEHITVIQPKQSIGSEDDTEIIIKPGSQISNENQIVYSDNQILVKLKGRPKGSTNSDIAKNESNATYSTVNTPGKRGRKSFKEIEGSIDLVNVPDDETLKKKLYHGISEVADWFGVNNSQIRYWENEFDVLKPRKTRKGDRLFRFEDVKTLQLIHHLLRNRKFSLEGAKEYLKANKQQADIHFELSQSLHKFRSFLLELQSNLGL